MARHCGGGGAKSACCDYGGGCLFGGGFHLARKTALYFRLAQHICSFLFCLCFWCGEICSQIYLSADTTLQSSHSRVLTPINGSWAKPAPHITFKIGNISLLIIYWEKPSTPDLMVKGALVQDPGRMLRGRAFVVLRILWKWPIPEIGLPHPCMSSSIFRATQLITKTLPYI